MNAKEQWAKFLGIKFQEWLKEHHPELEKEFEKFKVEMVDEEPKKE